MLLCMAFVVSAYTQSRESYLLFCMCLGCLVVTYFGLHLVLDILWYPTLCLYFLIFQFLSRSVKIRMIYFGMQFYCLLSVLEFYTIYTVFYIAFPMTMGLSFIAQLGVSTHGHYDDVAQHRGNNNKFDSFATTHPRIME